MSTYPKTATFKAHRKAYDAWTKTLDDTLYYLDWLAEKLRSNAQDAADDDGGAEFHQAHEFEVRALIKTLGREVSDRKRT